MLFLKELLVKPTGPEELRCEDDDDGMAPPVINNFLFQLLWSWELQFIFRKEQNLL